MSPYRQQRLIEGHCDIVVAAVMLVVLFAGLAVLPRSMFWFWFVPLGLFWVRWNFVRQRRDDRSLQAEFAADWWFSTPQGDRRERGVGLAHRIQHRLVAGEKL